MPDHPPEGSRRGAVAAIVAVALLMAIGLWLTHRLGHVGATQDCVSTGRNDCGP